MEEKMKNCKLHFFVFVVVYLVGTILPRADGHMREFSGLQTGSGQYGGWQGQNAQPGSWGLQNIVPNNGNGMQRYTNMQSSGSGQYGGWQGQNVQPGSWGLQNMVPTYGNSMQRDTNMQSTGGNVWPSQSLYSHWGYGNRMQNAQYGVWHGQNVNQNVGQGQGMQGYYTQPSGGNVWPSQNIYARWGYGRNQYQNSAPYSGQYWNNNNQFQNPSWGQNRNGQFSSFNGAQNNQQYGGNGGQNWGQSRFGSGGYGTGQNSWNGNRYSNNGNSGNNNINNNNNNVLSRSNRIVVVDDNTPTNCGGLLTRSRRAANIALPCDFLPNQVYASLANSDLGVNDIVVIMARTQSYPNTMNDIVNNYDYLYSLARKTNVILSTIPLTDNDYLLNQNINITNEKIKQIPSVAPVKVLDYGKKYAELKRLRLNLDRSGLCNWINAEVSGFLASPQNGSLPNPTWSTAMWTTEEPTTPEPTETTVGDGGSIDYGGGSIDYGATDYGGVTETTTEAAAYPNY